MDEAIARICGATKCWNAEMVGPSHTNAKPNGTINTIVAKTMFGVSTPITKSGNASKNDIPGTKANADLSRLPKKSLKYPPKRIPKLPKIN